MEEPEAETKISTKKKESNILIEEGSKPEQSMSIATSCVASLGNSRS